MVEIKHGKDRVGSAMLFLATDKDEQVFVAINSIELRAKLAPIADKLSDAVIEWVIAYAKKVGAKYTAMGVHGYNTGCFHLDSSEIEHEAFEGVAYRCYPERIRTDIEIKDEEAHRTVLASISKNHWMIIGKLAKLPIETRKDALAEHDKDFCLILVPEVLIKQKIIYKYATYSVESWNIVRKVKILREKLGEESCKKIPGSILTPRLYVTNYGEYEIFLEDFSHRRHCNEIEVDSSDEMLIVAPLDPDLAKEMASLAIGRPNFGFLATLLFVKQYMGYVDPDDYGYHCIEEFFGNDDQSEICFLEFTPKGCKLQRKIPEGHRVKHWLYI